MGAILWSVLNIAECQIHFANEKGENIKKIKTK